MINHRKNSTFQSLQNSQKLASFFSSVACSIENPTESSKGLTKVNNFKSLCFHAKCNKGAWLDYGRPYFIRISNKKGQEKSTKEIYDKEV